MNSNRLSWWPVTPWGSLGFTILIFGAALAPALSPVTKGTHFLIIPSTNILYARIDWLAAGMGAAIMTLLLIGVRFLWIRSQTSCMSIEKLSQPAEDITSLADHIKPPVKPPALRDPLEMFIGLVLVGFLIATFFLIRHLVL